MNNVNRSMQDVQQRVDRRDTHSSLVGVLT